MSNVLLASTGADLALIADAIRPGSNFGGQISILDFRHLYAVFVLWKASFVPKMLRNICTRVQPIARASAPSRLLQRSLTAVTTRRSLATVAVEGIQKVCRCLATPLPELQVEAG